MECQLVENLWGFRLGFFPLQPFLFLIILFFHEKHPWSQISGSLSALDFVLNIKFLEEIFDTIKWLNRKVVLKSLRGFCKYKGLKFLSFKWREKLQRGAFLKKKKKSGIWVTVFISCYLVYLNLINSVLKNCFPYFGILWNSSLLWLHSRISSFQVNRLTFFCFILSR